MLFPNSQSPQYVTALVEDDISAADQDPVEFPLTLRGSSNSRSAAELVELVEQIQPDMQPCQPACAAASPAATHVLESHAAIFNPAKQVPAVSSDKEVMSTCIEITLPFLEADNPVQAVHNDAGPCENLQIILVSEMPEQLENVCNDATPFQSLVSVSISSPNADHQHPHICMCHV